jgi:hypothetical protein
MNWMSENKLKLNTDKTELLILSSKFRAEPMNPVLTVGLMTYVSQHLATYGTLLVLEDTCRSILPNSLFMLL